MHGIPKSLVLALMIGLTFGSCAKQEEPAEQRVSANARPETSFTPATPARPSPTVEIKRLAASGFDINRVPVVNPELGKFPHFSLIEGYKPTTIRPNYSRDCYALQRARLHQRRYSSRLSPACMLIAQPPNFRMRPDISE